MQQRIAGSFARASRICLRLIAFLIPALSFAGGPDHVQVQMENVNFHVGHGVELRVRYLAGQLASAMSRNGTGAATSQPPTSTCLRPKRSDRRPAK